ncbi:hypothetical protein Tco_0285316 [Tanacetum coccineum]
MMASMDEAESTYRDSSGSKTFDSESITEEERFAIYASTSHLERVTPSSRSGDHRCSRCDSPEYDRREGRVVSRYIVMI